MQFHSPRASLCMRGVLVLWGRFAILRSIGIDRCSGHVIRLALRHQRYFTWQAGCKKLTRDLLYCFRSCGLCPDWSCQDWRMVCLSFPFASFVLASCGPVTMVLRDWLWNSKLSYKSGDVEMISEEIICNISASYFTPNKKKSYILLLCNIQCDVLKYTFLQLSLM